MSQRRGRLEENPELESAVDWVTDNYHVPVVALLLAFMLWSRLRSVSNFVADGEVLFSGNDAWYHYRTVSYTVQNWPETMPFDPWTFFPYGNASGQFGTLFDQIVATVALVVGLGSPDQQTVAMTLLVAPAFFGAAAAIPAYFIGRRLGGRLGGVTAVTVLAFSVGSFYRRSLVGFSDHHVAEALFQTLGILGVMVAVSVAHREKPIYEQVLERDLGALRPSLAWSALAGVGISLYLWVWPFGVLLVGVVAVYLLLQMCIEVVRGESPEHTAFAGAVMLGVTGVLMLSSMQTATITANDYSLLHPFLAFSVAAGCVFMAWLAREWEERDLDARLYPAGIGAVILAILALMAVAVPDFLGYFVNQFLRIFGLGFTTSASAGTVGEVQPLVNWENEGLGAGIQQLFNAYGFALFISLVGALVVVTRYFWDDEPPAEHLLVVVWLVFMTATTFTQARFQYYLVFPVAALTGYTVSLVVGWLDVDGDVRNAETYQILAIGAILLVILGPLAPAAVTAGGNVGPGQGTHGWHEGLSWMDENTPVEGAFNGSDNEMEYYGTYPRVDDHDYEAGQYGVISWWDYGHHITSIGERIPTANPFQQGTNTAAEFLLSQNESAANDAIEETSEDDAETRYVVVDWKMAQTYTSTVQGGQLGGKFFAPSNFHDGFTQSDFYAANYFSTQNNPLALYQYKKQPYYDSTVNRLYNFHGSAVEPEPIVIDWELREHSATQTPLPQPPQGEQTSIRQFDSMEEARAYAENDSTAQVGGIGPHPSERVPAMEHYRLVDATERSAMGSSQYTAAWARTLAGTGLETYLSQQNGGVTQADLFDFTHQTPPSWVKTFERVPGATIEGTGPADTTVTAAVQMNMPGSNQTFVYQQRAQTNGDGEFELTVPYSTTGYDEWGTDEGHTNVSVRANSQYQFQTATRADNGTVYSWRGAADVTEGQVVGEDDSVTTVDMERSVLMGPDEQGEAGNESGNATSGAATGETVTDGATEDGASGNETGGQTAGSLVPDARD